MEKALLMRGFFRALPSYLKLAMRGDPLAAAIAETTGIVIAPYPAGGSTSPVGVPVGAESVMPKCLRASREAVETPGTQFALIP
jgi:hypothetical protein